MTQRWALRTRGHPGASLCTIPRQIWWLQLKHWNVPPAPHHAAQGRLQVLASAPTWGVTFLPTAAASSCPCCGVCQQDMQEPAHTLQVFIHHPKKLEVMKPKGRRGGTRLLMKLLHEGVQVLCSHHCSSGQNHRGMHAASINSCIPSYVLRWQRRPPAPKGATRNWIKRLPADLQSTRHT